MRSVLAWWRLLNLPCREISRLVSAELDRPLSLGERLAVSSHLLYCSACRRLRTQLRLIREVVRRLASEPERHIQPILEKSALPDEVRDRIRRVLRSG